MKVVRNHRGLALAVVSISLFQGVVFPGIAHAGFFDFLLGEPAQTPAVTPHEAHPGHLRAYPSHMRAHWDPGPGPRRHADRGFDRADGRFSRHEHKLMPRRKAILADKSDHPARPQGPTDLMQDDSLRKGDAVMTPTGIRIFAGHSGDRHEPEDFRKLSEIKGIPKRERSALAALDAQGSGIDGKPGMASGRSESELTPAPGETITDPQGRAIRYVGP